eukprot:Nitzschia sp. Nitz4//scaffold148_size54725//36020//37576//NITZ4_006662-RA/size54725-processed-gene-0.24-mRNA-1//-1//CDS//3329536760//4704//frame0
MVDDPLNLENLRDQVLEGLTEEAFQKKPLFVSRPNRQKDVQLVDTLLAQELNSLSLGEREKTYEELHGVDDVIDEAPDYVKERLESMQMEIDRIQVKPAYGIATGLPGGEEYLHRPDICLMFLRAEYFHPRKAAVRMLGYLECKHTYFGESCLTRNITYNDLDEDDISYLKEAEMQILPTRDRSGRAVYCGLNKVHGRNYKSPINVLRCLMYVMQTLGDNVESQKRGAVGILFHTGNLFAADVDILLAKEAPRVTRFVPIRISGMHICMDNPVMEVVSRIVLAGLSSDARARHRLHFGTYTELMYKLVSFGIPVEHFPVGEDGDIKKGNMERWIERRRFKEEREEASSAMGSSFKGIELPHKNDVLSGKGRPIQRHPGNIRFRALVDHYMAEYCNAEKGRKGRVGLKVFAAIQASHGRFLSKDNQSGFWYPISDTEALQKVNKAFLTIGTKMNRSNNTSNMELTTAFTAATGRGRHELVGIGEPIVYHPLDKKRRVDNAFCCAGPPAVLPNPDPFYSF